MKLWNVITDFFANLFGKNHPQVVFENHQAPDVVEDSQVTNQKYKFAFIIGHNEGAQGAVNFLNESEWVFNSRVARKAQTKLQLKGYETSIIFRPKGKRYSSQVNAVVRLAKELNIRFALPMHFNSAGSQARGCECLVTKTPHDVDNKMADMLTDMLNERLGISERHDDGINTISDSHNGAGMINGLNSIRIYNTLIEPAFANYRHSESQAIFENEDAYVNILVDFAIACCTGEIFNYNKD